MKRGTTVRLPSKSWRAIYSSLLDWTEEALSSDLPGSDAILDALPVIGYAAASETLAEREAEIRSRYGKTNPEESPARALAAVERGTRPVG